MSIVYESDGSVSLTDEGKLIKRPLNCISCPLCLLEDEVGPTVMFDVPAIYGDYCYQIEIIGSFTNVRLGYPIEYPEEMCMVMKTIRPADKTARNRYIVTLFPTLGMPLFISQPFRVVVFNPTGVVSAIGWFGKFQSPEVSSEMYSMSSITLRRDDGALITIDKPIPPP